MIVLDTHVWIWYVDSPDRLSLPARQAVDEARARMANVYLSSISTWEVYMLAQKGRLSLALSPEIWVRRCERLSFLRFQPVDNDIARLATIKCCDMHPDPADRMIAATALFLGATLVTKDGKMHQSAPVKCLW